MKKVLILGGAGFIGSNIAEYFFSKGSEITVVDGLLEKTGGKKSNLSKLDGKIKVIFKRIEETRNLAELIKESDLIIDCMAWTSHKAAIENPLYDLELNCKSHLYLINNLKYIKNKNIILLSSRGIYGNVEGNEINEETTPTPVDIQGIHKLTTENYFKFYSKMYDFNVIALRIPNCYGKNQIMEGDDIGLVGSFIRDSLLGKTIEVFGSERKRSIIYVADLVDIIWSILKNQWKGFLPLNISGFNITIKELGEKIISLTGKGKIELKELPEMVKNIDVGNALINEARLRELIGNFNLRKIDTGLIETINYFKENMN